MTAESKKASERPRLAIRAWNWIREDTLSAASLKNIARALAIATAAWLVIGFFMIGYWTWGIGPGETTRADALRIVLTMTAGVGGIVALTIAYRKQRSTEEGRFMANLENAARQLGALEPTVQFAGIYALASLADESNDERKQKCVDVLCGYLRLPYTATSEPSTLREVSEKRTWFDSHGGIEETRTHHLRPAEKEVRLTIIHTITERVGEGIPNSWSGLHLDFRGAVFDGGNFSNAHFNGGHVDFSGAHFKGGHVDFSGAHFKGGHVSFSQSKFNGATVDFYKAHFDGATVSFKGARFSGGTADFLWANFSASYVDFYNALFDGGAVSFGRARFRGGAVSFGRAHFRAGAMDFYKAHFRGGTVSFEWAVFSGGTVSFEVAVFNGGAVSFEWAVFSGGTVSFEWADFTGGTVFFDHAHFKGGIVSFQKAHFGGGAVDFNGRAYKDDGSAVDFNGRAYKEYATKGLPSDSGIEVQLSKSSPFARITVPFNGAHFMGGIVDFSGPTSWEAPPIVPWNNGPTPENVQPDNWPPEMAKSD